MEKSATKIKDTFTTLGESIDLPCLWHAARINQAASDAMIQEFYERVERAGGSRWLAAVGLDFAMREWRKENIDNERAR